MGQAFPTHTLRFLPVVFVSLYCFAAVVVVVVVVVVFVVVTAIIQSLVLLW